MNHDKAREFFSAYYEGNLEPGLKQSFEARLRSDSTLQADYGGFVEAMSELEALRFEPIETPAFLSDRIATRIDSVYGARRRSSWLPGWQGWARNLGFAAMAAVAIGGAVYSISARSSDLAVGGVAPNAGHQVDQLEFQTKGDTLYLSYQPSAASTILISSGTTGKEIQRISVNGKLLESPLENKLPNPALLDIQVLGSTHALVAIPGTQRSSSKSGEGQLKDFAGALASFYQLPVVLEVGNSDKPVAWSFTSLDPREAATDAVAPLGYSVDKRSSGVLTVMDH